MSAPIRCDSGGCYGEAEWKDQHGNRWCDRCKRALAAYRTSSGVRSFNFRREKRSAPTSSEKASVAVSGESPTRDNAAKDALQ